MDKRNSCKRYYGLEFFVISSGKSFYFFVFNIKISEISYMAKRCGFKVTRYPPLFAISRTLAFTGVSLGPASMTLGQVSGSLGTIRKTLCQDKRALGAISATLGRDRKAFDTTSATLGLGRSSPDAGNAPLEPAKRPNIIFNGIRQADTIDILSGFIDILVTQLAKDIYFILMTKTVSLLLFIFVLQKTINKQ